MLRACLFVGLGGFAGAVCRYLLSLLPIQGSFPAATLLTNFIGAVAIGAIAAFSGEIAPLPKDALLFLKTGVCGGFTTFSTFSLETLELLEGGKFALGSLYAALSAVLCVAGVFLGKGLVRVLCKTA